MKGTSKRAQGQITRSDLGNLILSPLAEQIDRARLELLGSMHEVNDSVTILARQVRRDLDQKGYQRDKPENKGFEKED